MSKDMTVVDAILFIADKTNANRIVLYEFVDSISEYKLTFTIDKEDLEIPLNNVIPARILDAQVDTMYIYPAIEGVVYYAF